MLLILSVQYYHYCCVFLQVNSTALHYAAEGGSNNVITFLLHHGAGVDDINDCELSSYVTTIGLYFIIVILISEFQLFIIFSEIIVNIANYYSKH